MNSANYGWIRLVCYVAAVVCFVFATFWAQEIWDWQSLIGLGLALFAFAHIAPPNL
jgi:hypothetical protein